MHTEQEENKKHCVPLFLFKLAQQLWHFFLVELHQTPDQPPPILPRKSISIAESVSLPNMYVKSPTKAQKAGLFVFTFKYLMLQWFLTPIPWYLEQQWPKIRKLKYYVDFNLSFSFLPPKKKKKQGDPLTQTMTMSQSRMHWSPPMKACSIRSRTLCIHVHKGIQLVFITRGAKEIKKVPANMESQQHKYAIVFNVSKYSKSCQCKVEQIYTLM